MAELAALVEVVWREVLKSPLDREQASITSQALHLGFKRKVGFKPTVDDFTKTVARDAVRDGTDELMKLSILRDVRGFDRRNLTHSGQQGQSRQHQAHRHRPVCPRRLR